LELGLGGEVIHSPDPADDFSEAQGLFNAGAGNAVLVASQTLAKGILYLGDKIRRWDQTPLQNLLLTIPNHVSKVPSVDSFTSYGTGNPPTPWWNIGFTRVTKSQFLTH
jgi:hypothetical protein